MVADGVPLDFSANIYLCAMCAAIIATAQQKVKELPLDAIAALAEGWQDTLLNCKDDSGLCEADTIINATPVSVFVRS